MRRRAAAGCLFLLLAACTQPAVGRGPSPPIGSPSPTAAPSAVATAWLLMPGFVPTSIAFFNAARGLIAGRIDPPLSGCPGGCQGLIAATRDSGRSWSIVDRTLAPVVNVTTFGTRDAWATTDCGTSPPCSGASLLHSDDAGKKWRRLGIPIFTPTFVSPLLGWGLVGGTPYDPNPVERTADGGRSWKPSADPCPLLHQGTGLRSVSFGSATIGWGLCSGEPSAGNQIKAVSQTIDGGANWAVVSILPSSGYAEGIDFRADGRGWLWEERGYSYRTTDAGQSWIPISATVPEITFPVGISFVSDDTGFMVMSQTDQGYLLLRSADGGATWQPGS